MNFYETYIKGTEKVPVWVAVLAVCIPLIVVLTGSTLKYRERSKALQVELAGKPAEILGGIERLEGGFSRLEGRIRRRG